MKSIQRRFIIPNGMPERVGSGEADTTAFVELVAAVRRFQNDLAGAAPTAADSLCMAALLNDMSDRVTAQQVKEDQRIAGRVWDVPGRAQYLSPPYEWREISDECCVGTVAFGQMYLGSLAVHGGALPLVYDEIMGALANKKDGSRCRTVNLCVRYRALTPIDQLLDLEVRLERSEGRKRFLSAKMTHGGVVLSEAEGIFVTLLPGQQ